MNPVQLRSLLGGRRSEIVQGKGQTNSLEVVHF